MAEKNQAPTAQQLAKKGNGVLVKHGNVWSYAGAPIDRSGTNLQLPEEYITDAEVREMLESGELVVATHTPMHEPMAVRVKGDEEVAVVSTVQAGTPEAGTELPPNSRVESDAGMKRLASAEAAELAERTIHNQQAAAVQAQLANRAVPLQVAPEGAERSQAHVDHKSRK